MIEENADENNSNNVEEEENEELVEDEEFVKDEELVEDEDGEEDEVENYSNNVEEFKNYKEAFVGNIKEDLKTNNILCKSILLTLLFYILSHERGFKLVKSLRTKIFKNNDKYIFQSLLFFIISYLILIVF